MRVGRTRSVTECRAASPDVRQGSGSHPRRGGHRPVQHHLLPPASVSSTLCQQHRRQYSPELVSGFRRYLQLTAAAGPAHESSRLQALLQQHLPLDDAVFQELWSRCAPWRSLVLKPDLQQPEAALARLLLLFQPKELAQLLTSHPDVLTCGAAGWLDFFESYGFSQQQIKNIIVASPDVLTEGSVGTAGLAILRLKELGFDDDEVRHRVIPFCPQVLSMEQADIDTLIRLWSKFKVGVDDDAWQN